MLHNHKYTKKYKTSYCCSIFFTKKKKGENPKMLSPFYIMTLLFRILRYVVFLGTESRRGY